LGFPDVEAVTVCTCQNPDAWLVYWGLADRSGGSPVLVDDAAQDLSSPYRGVERGDDAGIVAGWVLVETLVWPVYEQTVPRSSSPAGSAAES
jgi:hypothetical protein